MDEKLGENLDGKIDGASSAPHVLTAALTALFSTAGGEVNLSNFKLPKDSPYTIEQLQRLQQDLKSMGYLSSMAQVGGVNKVNKFLADKGFSIQLRPIGIDDIAVASTMAFKVEWADNQKATVGTINLAGKNKEVPSVSMKNIRIYDNAPGFQNPVIEIPTKNGFTAFVSKYTGNIKEGDLNRLTQSFSGSRSDPETGNAQFPMVDFNKTEQLTYPIGLKAGNGHTIAQAMKQSIVQVNDKGAIVKEAVAIAATKGLGSVEKTRDEKIDDTFVMWFRDDKTGKVVASYFVREKFMKNPGNLDLESKRGDIFQKIDEIGRNINKQGPKNFFSNSENQPKLDIVFDNWGKMSNQNRGAFKEYLEEYIQSVGYSNLPGNIDFIPIVDTNGKKGFEILNYQELKGMAITCGD